jgi:hypothetical protein
MDRIQSRRRAAGAFTLAELLVAAGITGLIGSICMVSFVAIQRCYELSMARSGVRTNVVRILDAMEVDLRNASSLTAAVSGGENVLPLTLTIPQRYSDYEPAASMAGDPGRAATRLLPTFDVKTAKLQFPEPITVTFSMAAAGATAKDLTRAVTWTAPGGAKQTASRVIATVPADTKITFGNATGGLLTANDLSIVAKVSAQSNSKAGRTSAPIAAASTIFLRTKSLK